MAADVADIHALVQQAYARWVPMLGRRPTPMRTDYHQAITQHRVDLLREAGELIALVEWWPSKRDVVIESVAVLPLHQQRGIGRALLQHVEVATLAMGLSSVRLRTNRLFDDNIRLFRRCGFVVEREQAFLGGSLVYMVKQLAFGR